MTQRYHIWTEGCQMNVADSAKLAAGLDRFGWLPTESTDDADLVVLNTCVVRDSAEHRAVSKLGRLKVLKRQGAGFRIVVMGCMVGPKDDDLRKRFPYVDHFARPQAFEGIFETLGLTQDDGGEFWPATFPAPSGPTAYVPVIHGCDKFCTYCIVPYRRGREASRPLIEIKEEVAHAVHGDVREVTLLGQTVEAYGHDLPGKPDLADLMTALHELPNLERIRFLTSYPKDMTPRIIEAVRDLPKVCEFFNIPVQAGSDPVLDRMRRGYTIAEYREKVDLIRDLMPQASITTDVIVGFCGETDAEFAETLQLLSDIRFDKVHVAAYSPRPGTIAFRQLEDDVPLEVKKARLHAIEELEARVSEAINLRLEGTEQEVLVEGRRDGRWFGRTRSNKLVHFVGDTAIGDVTTVHIDHATAWSLQGTTAADALPLLI
ncbi:MAG: tRNA (N6-isopentenyl adenosine(37)-C2)-methylthiotransferase MiaB [Dehalococcoidia bacterium]|nr:tRNA (N6-isopentenyl adenosine(37)-C2)-methylthiotransferase MiaB [Dehalococcoidia bacterium]